MDLGSEFRHPRIEHDVKLGIFNTNSEILEDELGSLHTNFGS